LHSEATGPCFLRGPAALNPPKDPRRKSNREQSPPPDLPPPTFPDPCVPQPSRQADKFQPSSFPDRSANPIAPPAPGTPHFFLQRLQPVVGGFDFNHEVRTKMPERVPFSRPHWWPHSFPVTTAIVILPSRRTFSFSFHKNRLPHPKTAGKPRKTRPRSVGP
jgi:hypothetical protein